MVRMNFAALTNEIQKQQLRWCAIAAVVLAAATAGFVVWQNSRVAVLWDLGYLLNTSWRMALGQVPYRDFAQVHAPMTFVVQAVLMKIFGRHFFISWIYAAVMGGVGTFVAWRTLAKVMGGWLAVVMTTPLIFVGVYGVYPHPIYDCDCGFWILMGVWLLVEMEGRAHVGWVRAVVTGAVVVVPIFYKQNMGLPFAAVVGLGLLVVGMMSAWNPTLRKEREGWGIRNLGGLSFRIFRAPECRVLIGMVAAAVVAVVVIQATVGVGNYLHWTVGFAAQRRMPGLSMMLDAYREPILWWALPVMLAGWGVLATPIGKRLWAQILAVGLMAAPFVWTVILFFVNDDADDRADSLLALWPLLMIVAAVSAVIELRRGVTVRRVMPFVLLAAIHGSFLSQQLWGSTYGVWPLLMVLVAGWMVALPRGARWVRPVVGVVIAAVILFCGGYYAVSLERLSYVNLPEGDAVRATLPVLRGMATNGPYVENFEGLLRFAEQEIPRGDGVMILPSEDPFYFATGRVPVMPVVLMDRATDPYSARGFMDEARRRDVKWVIVKTDLQSVENPMPEGEETLRLVGEEFGVYRELKGYEVYRRK